jgi:uncharacterized protein (DUF885 family)
MYLTLQKAPRLKLLSLAVLTCFSCAFSSAGAQTPAVGKGLLDNLSTTAVKPLTDDSLRQAAQAATDAGFQALIEDDWDHTMRTNPEWATSLGDHRFDNKLSDGSLEARKKNKEYSKEMLALLSEYKVAQLSKKEQLNYLLMKDATARSVESHKFEGLEFLSLSAMGGVHTALAQTLQDQRLSTEADYRNYIARINAYPLRVEQEIAHLRRGMAAGWVTFQASLNRVPAQIDQQVLSDAEVATHPIAKRFDAFAAAVPQALHAELRAGVRAALVQSYFPALRTLSTFVKTEYLPKSPANGAMSAYPGGAAAYEFKVREQTTTALGAKEIHAIGLREVARVRADMEALIKRTGFKGSFAEFTQFINSDPRFFYKNGDDLLKGYRAISKRVDAQLPKLFAALPKQGYEIRAIPAHEGRDQPEYYTSGAPDGSRPGYFNANVLALARRPIWEMEALFVHEAVPGHHLQTARALELGTLPMFRRTAWYVAYGEGWALYAESLGDALGLYTDPYSKFGQQRMEIWRAARLVVDTGIHSMGWTRDQAINYMTERSGIDRDDVASEVDRYYVWPGQALGYMIGKLKIEELRDKAKAALGSNFDLRKFHMAILDDGAVPLSVMEQRVTEWIAAQRS